MRGFDLGLGKWSYDPGEAEQHENVDIRLKT